MAETLRLFFALWPNEGVRSQLGRAVPVAGPGGRMIPLDNLHVTLAFLGNTDPQRMGDLEAVAADVRGEPFVLTLDRYEIWDRALVVLIPSELPAALAQLVSDLNARLARAGFPVESRRYRAHATLIRERQRGSGRREGLLAPEALSAGPDPVTWPIDEFALVRSQTGSLGSRYEVLFRRAV
ncbi:MAG: RNA 2',3'-cyclic phosphodiesterase [Steroidobacteraceae bacterium]